MNNITCGLSTNAGNPLTFFFAVCNNRPGPAIGRAGKRPKIRVSNSLELLRGNEKYFRSEIANLTKIPHVFPTWLLVFVRVRLQAVLFYPFWNLAHLLPYNFHISVYDKYLVTSTTLNKTIQGLCAKYIFASVCLYWSNS